MNKQALQAYLRNNNLEEDGVYGYYEFNTGLNNLLYNNYYSGENYVLISVTGLKVIDGGQGYVSSVGTTNNSGDLISISGEHKNIPFEITASNGVVTSAQIVPGNVGGNVAGNIAGNPGNYTGLYFETPDYSISNTAGEGLVLEILTAPNTISGTRLELDPFIIRGQTGTLSTAFDPASSNYGSGYFSGISSMQFQTGFLDENWTLFVDCNMPKQYAAGKSKILVTSYENWNLPSGFALTIDDSSHLNFEYRSNDNQVESLPTNILVQENNLISVSKDLESQSIIVGKHDLSEDRHEFSKFEVNYNPTKNLFVGGYRFGFYTNPNYTGFSGYINEVLLLNQSCNSEQLTDLSNLFSVTGYSPASTGSLIYNYPLVTSVDSSAVLTTGSGVVGYTLNYDNSLNVYVPDPLSGAVNQTGILISYDPVNSGEYEEIQYIDEIFYVNQGLKNKYAPKIFSFFSKMEDSDSLEFYSFNSFDSSKKSNSLPVFSSIPGALCINENPSGDRFNLYNNGVYSVSGVDYDFVSSRSLIDSNKYNSFSNSIEDNTFIISIPEQTSEVSGFQFLPTNGQNYTYSSFPYDLTNTSGYLLHLNGQKLVQGASFDYTIAGGTLTINNAANQYESGNIEITNIRSGSSRYYANSYGVVGSPFYYTGFNSGLIDEVVFLNGQRLIKDFDYLKVSSGTLLIKSTTVEEKSFPFFTGETTYFNV